MIKKKLLTYFKHIRLLVLAVLNLSERVSSFYAKTFYVNSQFYDTCELILKKYKLYYQEVINIFFLFS